jgi:membrane protein
MSFKKIKGVVSETFSEFGEDRVLRLSAAMAYYTVFSIGPLLVLIVGIAGLAFGQGRVRHELTHQIQSMVGAKSAHMVESMMTSQRYGGSLVATIVGGVALLMGAAGVFGQLQDALNTIWEVKAKPGAGIWGFIRDRFFSIAMVLGIGFLLLVSMVLSAAVNAFAGYISQLVSLPPWVAVVFNEFASLLVITVLFAFIFKFLPDVKIPWRSVWIGAVFTALLFTAGKFVLGWYLGRPSTASAYGMGSAFVLVLLYIYYSSLILFLGAEFTQVYARAQGVKIVPAKYAVPVAESERAEQGSPHDQSPQPASAASRETPAPEHAPAKQPKPAVAYAHSTEPAPNASFMQTTKTIETGDKLIIGPHLAPGRQIRLQPWSFVGLALSAGIAAGLLIRYKILRKGLKLYLTARKLPTYLSAASNAATTGR